MFILHPQLKQDCLHLGDFPLCQLLLRLDANYPWCILVPAHEGITEIHQLNSAEQQQLMRESSALSQMLMTQFQGDKMNIAALGNKVSQCHIHHIIRYTDDVSWPHPVWDYTPAMAYQASKLNKITHKIQSALINLKPVLPFAAAYG